MADSPVQPQPLPQSSTAATAPPVAEPAGRPRSWLVAIVAALVASVLVVIFAAQNSSTVAVHFLYVTTSATPLYVLILIGVLAGYVLGLLTMALRRVRRRRPRRR